MAGTKIYASTESAEVSEVYGSSQSFNNVEQHQETFQCLTNDECTKWYLLAQVGNSQIKIPAKGNAVRFVENAEELPILTKD